MGQAIHPSLRIADAETARQLRSRFETILNVPERVRLRLFLPAALLADGLSIRARTFRRQ